MIADAIPRDKLPRAYAIYNTGFMFGGAVITESVFGLPGMGNLLLDSVNARDAVVVLAIVMIGAVLVLAFNTLADILYGVLDPRVRVT
jgi:ABC-type dipeptide/oligopeptide/nickel transport system permease component